MNADPQNDALARFATAGETLDPAIRKSVLEIGSAAVPRLLSILDDEETWAEDSPGSGWPPIHAVDLLTDMKATEGVEPMLRVLVRTNWDDIIHDRVVVRLSDLGAAVLEPALKLLATDLDEEAHESICCVLAKLGVKDARIYRELCSLFDEDELQGAMCFGDYGDPAALPLLVGAIEDFEPDFDSRFGLMNLADLIDAYERLGGPLPVRLQQKADNVAADFKRHRRQQEEQAARRPGEKVGRNELCPCGSGRKFKKCCIDQAPRLAASSAVESKLPPGSRFVDHGGQRFVASKGITDADLNGATNYFANKRRGQGPAQQVADFAQPLLEGAKDADSLQKALSLGMVFWNVAVCKDQNRRSEMLDELVKQTKNEEEAREFRVLAAQMLERHQQMFPEMHGK